MRAIEAPVSALIVMFSRSGSNFVRSANFEIPMSLLACSSRVCVPVNGTASAFVSAISLNGSYMKRDVRSPRMTSWTLPSL